MEEDGLEEALLTLDNLGVLSFNKIFSKENIILTSPRVNKKQLNLNYKKINESYLNLRFKVDRMVSYVYSLDCRFKFILDYFGEDVAEYKCGRCDKCSSKQGLTNETVDYVKEIISKTLNESGQELTETSLIQILRGKSKLNNAMNLSSFGSFSNYTINDLKMVLRQMVDEKLINKGSGKNKILAAGYNANTKLVIDDEFENKLSNHIYEENLILFNSLREVRTKTAKKFLQSTYLICPDDILRKVADKKPKTKSELLSVEGFNNRMFSKMGEEILEVVNEYIKGNETNKKKPEGQKNIPQNILETYHLLKKGYSLKDIASLRKLAEPVISMQIETIIEFQPEINISHLFENGILELIKTEVDKGYSNIKEIKERLPNDYFIFFNKNCSSKIQT